MISESQEVREKGQIPIPSELEGKNLGAAPKMPESGEVEGVVSVAETSELDGSANLDSYTQHLHSYIREYISVADRKASFIFTIGAALLVFLYEKGVVVSWLKTPNTWAFSEFIAFLAIGGLAISCILAVVVIVPRLSGSKRGFVFWESIAEFDTPSEFSEAAQKLVGRELTREFLRHAYELSKVCKYKYRILNWSLRVGAVGAVSTIIYLVKG